MGLGSTAKKLQDLADAAEKLFRQLSDLRDRVSALEERIQSTVDSVDELGAEQRRQRALLEAMAEEQGVDVDAILAEVESEQAADEPPSDPGADDPDADNPGANDDGETAATDA